MAVKPKDLSRLAGTLRASGLEADNRKIRLQLKSGYGVVRLTDTKSQFPVDLIIQDSRIRRRKGSFYGLPTYYQSPESLIISKLRMMRVTVDPERRFKDRADIETILENTLVETRSITKAAKKDLTLEIFEEITSTMKRKRRK